MIKNRTKSRIYKIWIKGSHDFIKQRLLWLFLLLNSTNGCALKQQHHLYRQSFNWGATHHCCKGQVRTILLLCYARPWLDSSSSHFYVFSSALRRRDLTLALVVDSQCFQRYLVLIRSEDGGVVSRMKETPRKIKIIKLKSHPRSAIVEKNKKTESKPNKGFILKKGRRPSSCLVPSPAPPPPLAGHTPKTHDLRVEWGWSSSHCESVTNTTTRIIIVQC